jgi:protein phosphatase 1G
MNVASVGDSTILVGRGSQFIELTNDHTLSCPDEYHRVINKGATVLKAGGCLRLEGKLAVTRSIGDLKFKSFISNQPENCSITLTPQDKFVILASDGLFQNMEK